MKEFREGDSPNSAERAQQIEQIERAFSICEMLNGDTYRYLPNQVIYYYSSGIKEELISDTEFTQCEETQALESIGIHVMNFINNSDAAAPFSVPLIKDGGKYASALNDMFDGPTIEPCTRDSVEATIECTLAAVPYVAAKTEGERLDATYSHFKSLLFGAYAMDRPFTEFDQAIYIAMQEIGENGSDIRLGLYHINAAPTLQDQVAVFQQAFSENSLTDYAVAQQLELLPVGEGESLRRGYYSLEELQLLNMLLCSQYTHNPDGKFTEYTYAQVPAIMANTEEQLRGVDPLEQSNCLASLIELRETYARWSQLRGE